MHNVFEEGIETILGDERARAERRERMTRAWSQLSSSSVSVIGLGIIGSIALVAIFAPILAPYPEHATGATNFANSMAPPSLEHPMGTDHAGRDIFSRIIFGSRISLTMGLIVLGIAIPIGVSMGLVAGYLGGKTNALIMRSTDVFLSIPPTLLALAVIAAIEPTLRNAMIAIAFAWWPWYARLVQGEVLSIKEEGFVEASESLGAGWFRIAFKEVLPNAITPITVKATIDMSFVILVGAALGFLGLGAQEPTPEWGVMIAQGRAELTTAWWLATFPGIAISYTVLGFNLLGDGLRDVFDVDEVMN